MILVSFGGEVRQRILTLLEPVSQEQLSSTADHLTHLFSDKNIDGIKKMRSQLSGLDLDITGYIIDDMKEAEASQSGEVYLDGLTNVLNEPEFSNSEDARRALRLLEERSLLQDILLRTTSAGAATSAIGGAADNQNPFNSVQVLIGGEGTWEELRHFSFVLSRYGTPGYASGTMGVLGPMRLQYGRTISTMRFLSRLLSDMVSETQVE